jgi:hypothetical protein
LLFADRLFQRENNEMPAQTSDENRWPIFVVADLDTENVAFAKDVNPFQQITRAPFDLAEGPEHFAARGKNSGGIALFCECFLPRFQQWI